MSIGSALLGAVLAAASVTSASTVPAFLPAPPSVLDRSHPDASTSGRWTWPLDPRPAVERRFDPPDQPWLPGHRGVDLAASVGQPVLAPTAGRITYSGMLARRGVVVLAHEGGLRSTFEPVAGVVAVGTTVARGDVVGIVTSTAGHCAPGVCLHWGVLRGRTYLDPLGFVGRARVILLPLS